MPVLFRKNIISAPAQVFFPNPLSDVAMMCLACACVSTAWDLTNSEGVYLNVGVKSATTSTIRRYTPSHLGRQWQFRKRTKDLLTKGSRWNLLLHPMYPCWSQILSPHSTWYFLLLPRLCWPVLGVRNSEFVPKSIRVPKPPLYNCYSYANLSQISRWPVWVCHPLVQPAPLQNFQ